MNKDKNIIAKIQPAGGRSGAQKMLEERRLHSPPALFYYA
jgi:hypothetical protein